MARNFNFWSTLARCCGATLLLVGVDCHAEMLRGPVNLAEQRSIFGEALSARSCPRTEPLPNVLTSITFYSDPPFYSRIDPVRLREFYEAIAPIRNAEEAIAQALSAFVRADAEHARPFGDCALAHLLRFATDNAMVETTELRGTGQVRLFSVTPIFAYAVLRGNYPIPSDQAAAIEAWIRRLANRIRQYQREHWYGNNIEYWGAAGLALAAVVLEDRSLLNAALTVAEQALDEVTEAGLLPKEMARGDRALEYSLFATQALAVVMVVAESNGITALRARNDGAILRLMRTMALAVAEPESFIRLSGNPAAVAPDRIYAQNLAWVAFGARIVSDAEIKSLYCQKRPLYVFRAGGDWDALFGNPNRCRK
jgi:poly(beta-D-mannuronate) lyase